MESVGRGESVEKVERVESVEFKKLESVEIVECVYCDIKCIEGRVQCRIGTTIEDLWIVMQFVFYDSFRIFPRF